MTPQSPYKFEILRIQEGRNEKYTSEPTRTWEAIKLSEQPYN